MSAQSAPQHLQNVSSGPPNATRLLSLDPRQFSPNDINELLRVIDQSNRYGREIERSVEELATLLQKKTLECEGLRKLAAENHSALAEAVKNEYNSRVRIETRQGNEIRTLQMKISSMRMEKDELQQEVEALRMMVKHLQATPPQLSSRENHSGTLFNRIAQGNDIVAPKAPESIASWNLPRPTLLTPAQRDLVTFVGNMSVDAAQNLQSSGAFDFLLVLCQRLCTPVNATGDLYPELGPLLGELLRELRADSAMARDDNLSASMTGRPTIADQANNNVIPIVERTARQKVIDLYLVNNPSNETQQSRVAKLHALLEKYEGREEQLYQKLLQEYKSRDPKETFKDQIPPPNFSYLPNAPKALAGLTGKFDPQFAEATDTELRMRITFMYKKYNPAKLNTREYQELLEKYPADTLLRALIQRYGPEPNVSERKRLAKMIVEDFDD